MGDFPPDLHRVCARSEAQSHLVSETPLQASKRGHCRRCQRVDNAIAVRDVRPRPSPPGQRWPEGSSGHGQRPDVDGAVSFGRAAAKRRSRVYGLTRWAAVAFPELAQPHQRRAAATVRPHRHDAPVGRRLVATRMRSRPPPAGLRHRTRSCRKVIGAIAHDIEWVHGKERLLVDIAEAAVDDPQGRVIDVIFPVAGVAKLKAVIAEHHAKGTYGGLRSRWWRRGIEPNMPGATPAWFPLPLHPSAHHNMQKHTLLTNDISGSTVPKQEYGSTPDSREEDEAEP